MPRPAPTAMRSATRRLPVEIVALCALLAAAASPAPTPRHDFESFRARMEDPARAQWQKPEQVVNAMGLRPGQRVADIGAGTGYFTALLARAVGPRGRVYAVDIDTAAVRYLRQRVQREQLPQVKVVQSTPEDPRLPGRVDVIFICDTWHHIENRVAYARVVRRHLTKTGRLVIVDFKPDADPSIGPPKAMRLSAEQVMDELHRGGFRVTLEQDFLLLQYVLTAEPEVVSPPDR